MLGSGLLATALTLKVLTLNVWGLPDVGFLVPSPLRTERMAAICQTLKAEAALPIGQKWEVILLQEAWDAADRATLKNCGYAYSADLEDPLRPLDSGLMILSVYPISNSKRLTYSNQASGDDALSTGESFAQKSALIVQVQVPGAIAPIWIANTHMISFYNLGTVADAANDVFLDTRRRQWKQYLSWTADMSEGKPLILGGDFNFGPGSPQWQEMDSSFGGPTLWSQMPAGDQTCTLCPPNLMHDHNEGKVDHLIGRNGVTAIEGQTEFTGTFPLPTDPTFSVPYTDHLGLSTVFKIQ